MGLDSPSADDYADVTEPDGEVDDVDDVDTEPTVVDSGRVLAQEFGEYLVISRIGRGGMGTVDLAIHSPPEGVERPVALKRLRLHLGNDPSFVKMFKSEVQIAARLSHPHVASVLDAGNHGGRWFFAMDLLFGKPLSEVIRQIAASDDPALHAFWPAVVCRLVADACEGLHAAHELCDDQGHLLGVVHRDVAPGNLFVGFDGAVRVIDFGIACLDDRTDSTRIGVIKGKLAYVAPERLERDAVVDRRVDVWGLGVTLWEALASDWLFRRKLPSDTIDAIRLGEIPALSSYRTDIPPAVETVIHKALSPDPEDRYASTREMGKELLEAIRVGGWHVGLPQVSEWMHELLPRAALRQRRLARIASVARRDTLEVKRSDIGEVPLESGKRARTPEDAGATVEETRAPGHEAETRIAPVWLMTMGALLGALLVAIAWLIVTSP